LGGLFLWQPKRRLSPVPAHIDAILRPFRAVCPSAAPLPKSDDLGLKSYDLYVKSYDLRIKSYDLCIKSYDLCIKSYDLRIKSYDLCIKSYDLSTTPDDLGSTPDDFGAKSSDLSTKSDDLGSLPLPIPPKQSKPNEQLAMRNEQWKILGERCCLKMKGRYKALTRNEKTTAKDAKTRESATRQ
jgi:hypothetical protein